MKTIEGPCTVITGDSQAVLRDLPDQCVNCCVTSPPYWGLRDYGTATWEGGDAKCDHMKVTDPEAGTRKSGLQGGKTSNGHQQEGFKEKCGRCGAKRIDSQLGLEKSPEEYVAKMVELFREVRRVLRDDGTLWLNLGDCYWGDSPPRRKSSEAFSKTWDSSLTASRGALRRSAARLGVLKPKDLIGMPWRMAFALQADGWWLRSDIIWHKPNPMPESVTDRPTKAHEYIFLLSKSERYFYDAEAIKEKSIDRESLRPEGRNARNADAFTESDPDGKARTRVGFSKLGDVCYPVRNRRSVWTVTTSPYTDAHFATYPPDLIKPCILAGTSSKGCCAKCGAQWERIAEDSKEYAEFKRNESARRASSSTRSSNLETMGLTRGTSNKSVSAEKITVGWQPTCDCNAETIPCTVLDPFAGSGTTGQVALELGRRAVLIELNPEYVKLIEQRCAVTSGLPLC